MIREDRRENGQMRQTALRLMRCLGVRAALDYCAAQQWTGLYEQIRQLDGRLETQH